MKKLPYMFIAALMAFASCGNEENNEPEKPAPSRDSRLEVVSDNGLFVPAEDGTSASLNFKNAGGEVVVSVSTNMENWTYDVSDDSWLDVTADKHYITLSAGQNESTESRKSAITVTASDNNDNSISYVINVSQNYAGQPEITVGANAVRFPAYGELSSEVVVETNQDDLDFDCTCQWLLVEKTDKGLKLTVDPNAATDQRTVDLQLKAGSGKDAASDVIRISQDGKAYLDMSSYMANASPAGGSREITYESNPELGITFTKVGDDTWFDFVEDKENHTIKVNLTASDGKQREGCINVLVGEKENTTTAKLRVLQIGEDTESLIFEVRINDDDYTFKNGGVYLTSAGGLDVTIDWGDGSEPEHFVNVQPSHKYAKAGKYTVETKGTASLYCLTDIAGDYFSITDGIMHVNFLNIISWGKLGVKDVKSVCKTDEELESIPDDVCGTFAEITDFTEMFVNCYSLKAIPENLFKYAVKAKKFYETFAYNASLKSIPENLFANCPEVTDFGQCFYGAGTGSSILQGNGNSHANVLKPFVSKGNRIEIPEGLFRNNTKATSFMQTFRDMNIATVPENLFANNTEVTSFNGLFTGCTELETVPADLFKNNQKVKDYKWLFYATDVKTLPVGLFKHCPSGFAIQINQMFQNSIIEDFPEGFFEGLDGVTSLSSLFENAVFMKPLKGGIFKGLKKAYSLSQTFYGTNVTELPEDLFEGLGTDATKIEMSKTFFGCKQLVSLPAGLFDPVATKLTTINACFQKCTGIKSIPDGFGNSLTVLTNAGNAFYGCESLESLPSEMFKGAAAKLSNLSSMFLGCTSLKSVPDGLFGFITVRNANFANCFNACTSLKSVGADVFPSTVSTTGLNSTFSGCTSLTDISGNVFAKCANVTTLMRTFSGCTALETLPSGLFAGMVKVNKFDQTFSGCTALESIPEDLFAKNAAANNFSKMFYECVSLKAIPAGLFANNKNAKDFNYMFYKCTSLTSVPAGLFKACTAAQNFSYLFVGCSGIKTIPADLFINCKSAYDFSQTFAGCSSLQEIPEGLFDSVPSANKNVKFSYCFDSCTSLKSIPSALFDKALMASKFDYAFAGCTGLTGESPYTMYNGNKIHLYERKQYYSLGGFNNRITGTKCFNGCTGLSDYEDITTGWK